MKNEPTRPAAYWAGVHHGAMACLCAQARAWVEARAGGNLDRSFKADRAMDLSDRLSRKAERKLRGSVVQ